MKIRNGFISNSSSSSFVCWGIRLDYDELIEKLKINQNEDDDFYDNIDEKLEETNLSWISNDNGVAWIGLSPLSIRDDETGLQFKNRAKEQLSKLLEEEVECEWFEEVIYG